MFSNPIQTISGLSFSINPVYARNWKYKSSSCSCTLIGPFAMLYINQTYIEAQTNLLEGLIHLLVSLNSLDMLDFGPGYNHQPSLAEQFIIMNLFSILHFSEISFAFDYEEDSVSAPIKRTRLETSLARHHNDKLWCFYDKRIYCSSSYKNMRDNLMLQNHPIRLEFHLNLKYGARYLNLGLLNNTTAGILEIFMPYLFKSWKRHCPGNNMPPLPYNSISTRRILNSYLQPLKQA